MDGYPMNRFIINTFKDLQSKQKINFNPYKKSALIGLISCIPEMITRVVIRGGNYMLSWRIRWLVKCLIVILILINCWQHIDVIQPKINTRYVLICFQPWYNIFKKKGHIEDELFENMGFLMGEITNWSFVRRDSTNNQEIGWRKKCSTHHRQVSLREEIIAIIEN